MDMEDVGSIRPIDLLPAAPAFTAEAAGDSLDPGTDEDDEWDMESMLSDTPSEVLVAEDEDDVVPRSFNLSTSADPSSNAGHSESDDHLSEPLPKPQEVRPSPHIAVYGSDSKYLSLSPPMLC